MRETRDIVCLGDVCHIIGGGTPSKKNDAYYSGSIPWATVRDMNAEVISETDFRITKEAVQASSTNIIPAGNVVIATRVGLGKVCLLSGDTAINQDLRGIIPKQPGSLLPRYLFYCFKTIAPHIISAGTGATVQGVKGNFVKSLRFPLPSLPEQQRIVAILDEAFAGIATVVANTEKNLASARELFESYLSNIFAIKGSDWERCKLADLLDRGWIVSHLDGNHGGDYPRKNEFIDHGILYISANCIKNNKADLSLAKYLAPERAALLRKGIAQDNDVLFAHNATVGPVAILHTDEEKVILGTSLTYYRCDLKHILPEYLAHYMRSADFTSQYKLVMQQSTRNQVPITKQREFFHVIPPLKDQQSIASQLDILSGELHRLESLYQHKRTTLADLKQSLLHKAFSGALTAQPERALQEAVA